MDDVTAGKSKIDFLISAKAFHGLSSFFELVEDPNDVIDGAEGATCEVVSEDDENAENISGSRKRKTAQSKPSSSSSPNAVVDSKNKRNVIQELLENESIGWTKQALLRLLHVIHYTHGLVAKDFSNLYIGIVQTKMSIVDSDESTVSEFYIHRDDIQKFRKWKKSENSSPQLYFRTNFDVDLSISKIKTVLSCFYDFSKFLSFRETKVGNYKINATDKAEISGSRKSSRPRKSIPT
uniref:Uncharacterized protein n=1 Tax=Panagrolaimus sp. ES5 TaxID=591445 RepID=A0AC34F984_9BILA